MGSLDKDSKVRSGPKCSVGRCKYGGYLWMPSD